MMAGASVGFAGRIVIIEPWFNVILLSSALQGVIRWSFDSRSVVLKRSSPVTFSCPFRGGREGSSFAPIPTFPQGGGRSVSVHHVSLLPIWGGREGPSVLFIFVPALDCNILFCQFAEGHNKGIGDPRVCKKRDIEIDGAPAD